MAKLKLEFRIDQFKYLMAKLNAYWRALEGEEWRSQLQLDIIDSVIFKGGECNRSITQAGAKDAGKDSAITRAKPEAKTRKGDK